MDSIPQTGSIKLKEEEDEEDDYMSMSFAEPIQDTTTGKTGETSIQRAARKKRDGEARARAKPKAEIAADESAAREAALETALDSSNKGFRMMAKLGFKQGETLGTRADARAEPIRVTMKEDRGGIGLDAERKRKLRDEAEREGKKVKAEEGDYRERVRVEREVKRLEGMVIGAMSVAERLDEGRDMQAWEDDDRPQKDKGKPPSTEARGLKNINLLWRGLVKHRREKEREKRMKYDLYQSLSRLPTYEDPDEDKDDKLAFGKEEEEVDEDDSELECFNALDPLDRLMRIVEYLRQTYHYCFWCKYQYSDSEMDGCPGITEEDHD